MRQQLLADLSRGDIKALARSISLVENELPGHEELLQSLPNNSKTHIIGITGPPGAGKSTLVDGLIKNFVEDGYKIAVLCIDPSSPFNHGAVLGDRIRMNEWYNHPDVFIRSLATRGSMGGLTNRILETTEIVKTAGFDYIIIETAGVGQTEIEIAALADVTVVVLVPEAGDVIQTMKAGLMEIAEIIVVNKSDRPDADTIVNDLKMMLAPASKTSNSIPVLKTVASEKKGIEVLFSSVIKKLQEVNSSDKKYFLLAEKAYFLIQKRRMKDVNKEQLYKDIKENEVTNLYSFLQKFQ